jgi:hypothetical protein
MIGAVNPAYQRVSVQGGIAPLAGTAGASVDRFRAFSPCSWRERALRIDGKKEVFKPK